MSSSLLHAEVLDQRSREGRERPRPARWPGAKIDELLDADGLERRHAGQEGARAAHGELEADRRVPRSRLGHLRADLRQARLLEQLVGVRLAHDERRREAGDHALVLGLSAGAGQLRRTVALAVAHLQVEAPTVDAATPVERDDGRLGAVDVVLEGRPATSIGSLMPTTTFGCDGLHAPSFQPPSLTNSALPARWRTSRTCLSLHCSSCCCCYSLRRRSPLQRTPPAVEYGPELHMVLQVAMFGRVTPAPHERGGAP